MTSDYQRHKRQYSMVQQGLLSSPMLFGAINLLLEQAGRRTYANLTSMTHNLRKRGLRPVCRDYYAWWNAKEVIDDIFRTRENFGSRVSDDCFLLPLTPAEESSGEWVLLHTARQLTGLSRQRIYSFINRHSESCRVDAQEHRRIHLPTIREWGDYRPSRYLRKMFGDELTDQLLATRKLKTYTLFGKNVRLVYVPEIAHL